MSLQVWLPLNGDLQNKGVGEFSTSTTSVTYSTNGKIGSKCLTSQISSISIPNMIGKKQMSFAYWVKIITATSTNWLDSFRWYSTDGTNDQSSRQEFYTNSTLTGVWFKADSSGVNSISGKTNVVGEWRHYVTTLDYQTGDVKFYINGSLVGYTKSLDTTHYIKGTSFLLHENNLDHAINDFRLYDHCLSLKEIKEISKGLALYIPLDGEGIKNANSNLVRGTCKKQYVTNHNDSETTLAAGSAGNGVFSIVEDDTVPIGLYSYNILNNTSGNRDFQQFIPYQSNKKYTGSWWAKGNGTCLFRSWNRTDGKQMFTKTFTLTQNWKFYNYTFTTTQEYQTDICTFHLGVTGNSSIHIAGMKLEQGQMATAWVPNQNDIEYSLLGLNENITEDSSGYEHKITYNNITYSSDTPKNINSTILNSINTSYIKVNENNWMAQHAKEMTVNLWAYAQNWTAQSKLFSCTESGGFNTQSGSSGYLRFPVYVCTNEAQTTYGYKYDSKQIKVSDLSSGWHMFTFIYEAATGTKTYIDGELHHTYNNISYGIHFNTNARLYLGCQASGANPASPYFTGKQSDFRIYYTCLSENDIKQLYNVRASGDRNSNFYTSGEFIEEKYSNQIECLYDLKRNSGSGGSFYQDENGLNMDGNIWINHDFISIDPTNKTYQYDITCSIDEGNYFYIGWQRYDIDKTSRGNNATIYAVATKPTSNQSYVRYKGTINLSTDGVNPCAFIRIRILNKWTGSTSDTEGKAIIHSLSLKEISSSDIFTNTKIDHGGNTRTMELLEKNNTNININRFQQINSNSFIEN